MEASSYRIKAVAVIGAGAAGAVAAAALKAEDYYDRIKIFERRSCAGGIWIFDPTPDPSLPLCPGALPPDIDPPLQIPDGPFPRTLPSQHARTRFETTPIYENLTTNVPDIAMSFTDLPFPYGPFAPHWIPRQYIENYFAWHRTDESLVLNTTVEDMSIVNHEAGKWLLTLRKADGVEDVWWQEQFDAVIIATGHYSVPFIPAVHNLDAFISKFPGRVEHSKTYRSPRHYTNKSVLVIGNSASGHDVMTQLRESGLCKLPIYVSRHSRNRWDGAQPPDGVAWKPIIESYDDQTGEILFADGTKLRNVDKIIYCTGYRPSFPFWNKSNGRPFYDYKQDRIIENYQHTFLTDFPTVAIVGMPRVLTFRSFEYQAIAVARLWSNRAARPLPSVEEQRAWLMGRTELTHNSRRRFHQIEWDLGEAMEWFRYLFELAGLPILEGFGRCPPVLGSQTRWAIDHVKKYPDHGTEKNVDMEDGGWEIINTPHKDTLWYI